MNASKGQKKVIANIKQKISSGIFDDDMRTLRIKYEIPLKGYAENAELVWDISFTNILSLPREWIHFGDKKKLRSLLKQIDKIKKDYHIENDFWVVILLDYLFFNRISDSVINDWSDDLCTVTDVVSESEKYNDRKMDKRKRERWIKEHNEKLDKQFPISIRISPYASINDIKDYINSRSSSIKNLQKNFKSGEISIGNIRTRSTTHRDRFIMEHENIPRKELVKLIKDEKIFGIKYDEQKVNDIISKIKKPRKK